MEGFSRFFRVPQKTSTHFCSILVGVCMCVYVGITERTNERMPWQTDY